MNLHDDALAERAAGTGSPAYGWNAAAALTLGTLLALGLVFRETALSIGDTWYRSETFAHGWLIVPISAWLIWRRRDELLRIPPRPCLPGIFFLGLLSLGWLLGHLGSVLVVQQFAFVAMLPVAVWTLLGTRVAWALAFPLGFLMFGVPVGEGLVPPMIDMTADFTALAIKLSGVPIYREGNNFALPSGNWSVVEACSGVRYLIASVTLGFLYAYLTYRSMARRIAFVAASIAVPIVANWVRAYLIVMTGHLSGMKYAVGVDHLIYGWLFFGLVMLILFWVGSFWREPEAPLEAGVPALATGPSAAQPGRLAAAAVAALAVAAAGPAYGAWLDSRPDPGNPVLGPAAPVAGWQALPPEAAMFRPDYTGPRAELRQAFARDGSTAGAYLAYYRHQHQGSELITSVNQVAVTENEKWKKIGEATREVRVDGQPLRVRQVLLRGPGGTQLVTWHWFWIGGTTTGSPYVAKLLQARSRLLGAGDDSALMLVYAPYEESPDSAAQTLQRFIDDMTPALRKVLDDAARG